MELVHVLLHKLNCLVAIHCRNNLVLGVSILQNAFHEIQLKGLIVRHKDFVTYSL